MQECKRVYRGMVFLLSEKRNFKKARPWLVVSSDRCCRAGTCSIVPLTRKQPKDLSTAVILEDGSNKSVILCDQVKTVDSSKLGDYLYTVSSFIMEKVEKALRIHFGLCDTDSISQSNLLQKAKQEQSLRVAAITGQRLYVHSSEQEEQTILEMQNNSDIVRPEVKFAECITFGQAVKTIRSAWNESVREMARKTGVSIRVVSNIEWGKEQPSVEWVNELISEYVIKERNCEILWDLWKKAQQKK